MNDDVKLSPAAEWICKRLDVGPASVSTLDVGVAPIVGLWDYDEECMDEVAVRQATIAAVNELVVAGLAIAVGGIVQRSPKIRCLAGTLDHGSSAKVDAFLAEIRAVCVRHGMVLESEDGHGSLVVEAWTDRYVARLDEADIDMPEEQGR